MKIAMIGSGAAGSVFASYIKKGGAEEVWLVDPNKAHMDKVAKDGMIFRNPDGEFHVTGFKTAYSAEEVGVADIVIIMVKATITELALKGAMCCVGPETVVVTLQNGLGNEEVVKKLIPEERVMFGCGNMGTELARTRHLRGQALRRHREHVLRPLRQERAHRQGRQVSGGEVRRRRPAAPLLRRREAQGLAQGHLQQRL